MATPQNGNVSKLLDQAMETLGGAMSVGVKMQEDIAKFWADALGQMTSVQDWQKKSRAVLNEAIPAAQKSADEYLRLFDQSYKSGMELVRKAVDSGRSETTAEAQAKAQELLEESMSALRSNAQAMVQANIRSMESWAGFLRKNIEEVKAATSSAT